MWLRNWPVALQLLFMRTVALLPLPSSSPAFAAMPLAEKEKLWSRLGEFLA